MKITENKKIKLIGYWRGETDSNWPNPSFFVDENWDKEEKEIVLNHLNKGFTMPYVAGGYSWCRFHCHVRGNGCSELTDGQYFWPEGLSHYVEKHNVKLPIEFINHCKSKPVFEEITFDMFEMKCSVDEEWWKQQKGTNLNGPTSFVYPEGTDTNGLEKHTIDIEITKPPNSNKVFHQFLMNLSKLINVPVVVMYKDVVKEGTFVFSIKTSQYYALKEIEHQDRFVRIL